MSHLPTGCVLRFVSFVGALCRLIWSKIFLSLKQEAGLDQRMSRQERSGKLALMADLLRPGAMVAFDIVVAAFERPNAAWARDLVSSALEVLVGTRTERGRAEVVRRRINRSVIP
jgi:hypothetical protein